MNTVVE